MPTGFYNRGTFSKEKKEEIRNKKIKTLNGKTRCKNNCHWKKNTNNYSTIHSWLVKNFGKANKCENPKCVYPRIDIW